MAKLNHKDYQRETERQMRDRMNGITRNKDSQIIKMNGHYNFRGIDEILIENKIWSK